MNAFWLCRRGGWREAKRTYGNLNFIITAEISNSRSICLYRYDVAVVKVPWSSRSPYHKPVDCGTFERSGGGVGWASPCNCVSGWRFYVRPCESVRRWSQFLERREKQSELRRFTLSAGLPACLSVWLLTYVGTTRGFSSKGQGAQALTQRFAHTVFTGDGSFSSGVAVAAVVEDEPEVLRVSHDV